MPAGRPIKYDKKTILTKVNEYLESCTSQHEVIQRPEIIKVGNEDVVVKRPHVVYRVKIPSFEGLAVYLGIHRDTIYDWDEKYPEFSDIIGVLKAKQAESLINNGLSGDYNSTIAKVLLTKHGYSDKQEISGPDGGPLKHEVSGVEVTIRK